MDIDEALEIFRTEGVAGMSKLTPEQLDLIQSKCTEAYNISKSNFDGCVSDACGAIENILESNKPMNRFINSIKNINNSN